MIAIYPHDTAPADLPGLLSTNGLGRIDKDVLEGTLRQKVNGDHSLSLTVPMDSPAYDLIKQDRLIGFEGQLYRILRLTPRDGRKGRTLEVEAPHIIYDLRDYSIVNIETKEDERYIDGITQAQALAQVLADTPFSPDVTNTGAELDYLDILQKPVLEAIKEQVLDLWGGELMPDNFTVRIMPQMGTDRRYPIRHRRNIKSLSCTIDIEPVVTRLHVRGYENANFEDINGGKDYIDSQYIGDYSHIREGYADFDDVDDPQELLTLGQQELAKLEIPSVKYEVDLLDLRGSAYYADYAALEQFDLGDTAALHHPAFNTDIITRCMELERDIRTGRNTRVVLGNTDGDAMSSLQAAVATAESMRGMMTTGGQLKAEKVTGKLRHVTLDSAQIDNLAVKVMEAVHANIEQLRVSYAQVDGLTANTAMFGVASNGKLYAADLMVTDANIESLAANQIAGGMAQLGELMLRGTDGALYRILIDEDGELSAEPTAMTSQNIGVGAITNTALSDGCITGRTLNVAEIFANEAMIHAIKARNLDVDELVAGDALVGKITSNHLADGVGAGLNITSNSYIQFLASALQSTTDTLSSFRQAISNYMRYDTQQGVLELGKNGEPYIVQIDNDSYAILKDGVVIAEIRQDEMYIPNLTAFRRITMGDDANGKYILGVSPTHLTLRCS